MPIESILPGAAEGRRSSLALVSSLFVLALSAGLARGAETLSTPQAAAPMPEGSSTEGVVAPLIGTWTLVAADDLHPDGTRTRAYGDNPQGILIVDPSGQYSLQLFRPERGKFAAGDKLRGTPEEYRAAVLGMSSHIGHCALNPATGIATFRIDLASYPSLDGAVQQRQYKLEGDTFSYQIPAQAGGNGNVPISVWKKVR
ncbi:MAG: lipocalin-like domain-containing protein [Acidobacteriota bacterium]